MRPSTGPFCNCWGVTVLMQSVAASDFSPIPMLQLHIQDPDRSCCLGVSLPRHYMEPALSLPYHSTVML
jgi:hypothetical protein